MISLKSVGRIINPAEKVLKTLKSRGRTFSDVRREFDRDFESIMDLDNEVDCMSDQELDACCDAECGIKANHDKKGEGISGNVTFASKKSGEASSGLSSFFCCYILKFKPKKRFFRSYHPLPNTERKLLLYGKV